MMHQPLPPSPFACRVALACTCKTLHVASHSDDEWCTWWSVAPTVVHTCIFRTISHTRCWAAHFKGRPALASEQLTIDIQVSVQECMDQVQQGRHFSIEIILLEFFYVVCNAFPRVKVLKITTILAVEQRADSLNTILPVPDWEPMAQLQSCTVVSDHINHSW